MPDFDAAIRWVRFDPRRSWPGTPVLSRLQGYGADRRFRALGDCILFLQAQKLGLTVLTANVGDFDPLLQLLPSGRVLFYRRHG